MLRERDVGLAKLRVSSSFSTAPAAGTLVRVPSPNRRLEGTQATDAQILRRAVALVVLIFVVGARSWSGAPCSVAPPVGGARGGTVDGPRRWRDHVVRAEPERDAHPDEEAEAQAEADRGRHGTLLSATWRRSRVTRRGLVAADAVVPQRQRRLRVVRQFWDTVTRAVPRDVVADPRALTIGYTVDYTRRDGSTSVDSTRLRLVFRGGDYLIDGEG